MAAPRAFAFQNFIRVISAKVELLLYWAISQMLFVGFGVLVIMGVNYLKGRYYRYEKTIPYHEILWTVFPTVILFSVAVPSIALLYLHEQEMETNLTLKVTAHQWYWRYEYSDFEAIEFDSFIKPTRDLQVGASRFLEADNRAVVPFGVRVRFLVTSEDVLHALALPAIGVKIDAVPGRVNSISLLFENVGVFYGQCSELCGANHSFIPITLEVATPRVLKE